MHEADDAPGTLADALPYEAVGGEYEGLPFRRHLGVGVVKEHRDGWPGRHRNVYVWWELANGRAVGWNENKSVGWSFPVIRVPR